MTKIDETRQGAWAFLTSTVYEMADGWDSMPPESVMPSDFDKIARALDEWCVTYATGGFWPFNRQAFDAAGARFRAVCQEVLSQILMRPVLEDSVTYERMDAMTLLEEHGYFDPKAPPAPIPSGPSSGTGPSTRRTVRSAAPAMSTSSPA